MNILWQVVGVFLLASLKLADIYYSYGVAIAGPFSWIMIPVLIGAVIVAGWIDDLEFY